jgi:hypothetical protein
MVILLVSAKIHTLSNISFIATDMELQQFLKCLYRLDGDNRG